MRQSSPAIRADERIEKLQEFWDRITERRVWAYTPDGDIYRRARNATSALMTMTLGQPGFFKPHEINPWLSPAGARTRDELLRLDPTRDNARGNWSISSMINEGSVRFAVGAVNVLSGNFVYFDNRDEMIGPEHVMASGALPPALPMVKIGTDYFWDGGIVSNTPLQHVLDQNDCTRTRWSFKSICSRRAGSCRAIWRMFSAAIRTSSIPRAPATTPMSIARCANGRCAPMKR